MQLIAIVVKELRLLSRDMHGLALLFAMPVVFIVIMSLAMKADFDRRSGVQLAVWTQDLANSEQSRAVLEAVGANPLFQLQAAPPSEAVAAVRRDEVNFLLQINDKAFADPGVTVADIVAAPSNSPELNQLFVAVVQEAAGRQNLKLMFDGIRAMAPEVPLDDMLASADDARLVDLQYAADREQSAAAPTSVQQSVPAWLVFSMFFVVVPLATTLINERQLGTRRRLRTIDVPSWKLVVGKVIPYYAINQVQVLVMILVGVYLVPVLGGDRLTLGHSLAALVMIASALSIAALGYGMLIAVLSKTIEQATTLGGAGNIILAALGGVMVPTFVMPEFMQEASVISPMSWGLQGFLDVFLRGGGIADIWPETLSLLLLGALCLGLAMALFNRSAD